MSDGESFTYIGGELGLFAHAANWKNYWSGNLASHLKGDVLEVGAGVGVNTVLLRRRTQGAWTCLEPDAELVKELRPVLAKNGLESSCRIMTGTIETVSAGEKFDTIIYIDVLEHIPDDGAELARAAARLRPGGKVIVLSPAHQWLFSEFDKSIGHCRRYSRQTLLAASPRGLRSITCFYLDACGMFLSLANRLLLRQRLPTLKQILFWDRVVVPVSRVLDPLLFFRAGKSVVGVWQRKEN